MKDNNFNLMFKKILNIKKFVII